MTKHTPKEVVEANKALLKEQPKAWRENLTDAQKSVIHNYSNTDRLSAVLRWPQRVAKARITLASVAAEAGRQRSRMSEYCNFHVEPTEETYLKIESILYAKGA